jgi:hypothetical protein
MTPWIAGRRLWPRLGLGLVVVSLIVAACGGDDGPSLGGNPISSPGESCVMSLPGDCDGAFAAAVAESKTLHPEELAPIRGVMYERRTEERNSLVGEHVVA